MHPMGFEPMRPAWRAGILPLYYGCPKIYFGQKMSTFQRASFRVVCVFSLLTKSNLQELDLLDSAQLLIGLVGCIVTVRGNAPLF